MPQAARPPLAASLSTLSFSTLSFSTLSFSTLSFSTLWFIACCVLSVLAAAAPATAVIGAWDDPFLGSPPFPNLICCEDSLQCTDGDDLYANCRMPMSAVPNGKLCGYHTGEEEYPYVCDACPGAAEGDCDADGWVEVADGVFQCDGPVYRSNVGAVRQMAPNHWYINPGGDDLVECNESYDLCLQASCYETACISCSTIATSNGLGPCQNQRLAMCHAGALEGSTAELCCSQVNHACVRPNATTGLCSGSPSYDFGYDTPATCLPCPNPDNPANLEACHGWDLGDDWWPATEEELTRSINCSQHDEAGCNMAVYACDGTLIRSSDGVVLEDNCLALNCDGI